MADLWMYKNGLGHLAPSDDIAKEHLKRLKRDQQLLVKVTKPRNVGMHRKFMALMQMGFENQERYDTFTAFRKEVVMRAGWFIEHHHVTGKISYEAKSVSFTKMEEIEFQELFYKCIDVIIEHFMPGTSKDDIAAQVAEISGFAI